MNTYPPNESSSLARHSLPTFLPPTSAHIKKRREDIRRATEVENNSNYKMFFDPAIQQCFFIERLSSAGKTLRRVLVLFSDGGIAIVKLNGTVCRLFHVTTITHLVHAPLDGCRGKRILLRIAEEHDLLFSVLNSRFSKSTTAASGSSLAEAAVSLSAAQSQTQLASQSKESMELIHLLVKFRAAAGGLPLNLVEHENPELLREAANVICPPHFVKPIAVQEHIDHLYIPILFEDFEVLTTNESSTAGGGGGWGAGLAGNTPLFRQEKMVELAADAAFMTLLHRAVLQHPIAASRPPKVQVEAPGPFKPIVVSDRFFAAYANAFDEHLPLVIHVRSHLPTINRFRASHKFWRFLCHTLRVTRPPANLLALVTTAYIEASIEGSTDPPVTATLGEWNDMVVSWELNVRSSSSGSAAVSSPRRGRATGAGPGRGTAHPTSEGAGAEFVDLAEEMAETANANFWRAFVAELESARGLSL